MIGKSVFYVNGAEVVSSDVVATELRELKESKEVILTLRDGYRIKESRACFSLYELLVQLKNDYEYRTKAS